MRRLLAAAAVAATSAATLGIGGAVTTPAHADTPTCQGRPATVVGAAGQTVVGTAGPDVIVADNPARVDAGAGDDVVCVVSSDPSHASDPHVDLGAGADVYNGSIGARVDTGDRDDVAAGRAPSHDLVTAPGFSRVESGAPGRTDTDSISLDNSILTLYGVPAGSYDGGALDDEADSGSTVNLVDDGRHAWDVDEKDGTAQVDDHQRFTLSGFQGVRVWDLTWSSFTYRGTARADAFEAERAVPGSGPLHVRLGAGDDRAQFAPTQHVDAAGGRGTLDILSLGRIGQRPQGRLVLRQNRLWRTGKHPVNRIRAFEQAAVSAVRTATVAGTSRSESLSVDACRATVRGFGGNDTISLSRTGACGKRPGPFRAFGNAGDDHLFASPIPAVLVGGPGFDHACGQGRIEAEVTDQCG